MSTATPDNNAAAQQPQASELAEVLAQWVKAGPAADATDAELAAWFDAKAELLAPLADDTAHPRPRPGAAARSPRPRGRRAAAQPGGRPVITTHSGVDVPDLLCQHEFVDGSLCGRRADPDRTRCSGHRDDGQPDHDLVQAEQRGRR